MKNKNVKIIGCMVALIAILSICGIFAYLTDIDTASNKFTVGQVKIELQEPTWAAGADSNNNKIPDYAENIVPNSTIAKDPQIKNVGENSAYVYIKVTVPVESVITAGQDGVLKNSGAKQDTQLFTYSVNSDWKEIVSARETKESVAGKIESYTYVYYYNKPLAKDATSQSLFDTVTFANVIEGQVDLSSHQIDLEAYAIQSDSLPENTSIEGAYALYVNQNK